MEELGGAKIHSEVSGAIDLVAKNDAECLATIKLVVCL
jgi:acetyl-CoA carboxylase carboxyltransferase component